MSPDTPPSLSIICSIKNLVAWQRAEPFTHMLESIQSQYQPGIEVRIIDGGEEVETRDLVKGLIAAMPYATYHPVPDTGIYQGYENGLNLARGSWVTFMNSDDFFEAGALAAFMAAPKETADLIYGATVFMDGTDRNLVHPSLNRILSGMAVCTQSIFFRRQALREVGGWNTRYKIQGDYDLVLRGLRAGWRTHRLDAPIATFRLGGESAQQVQTSQEELALVWAQHIPIPTFRDLGKTIRIAQAQRFPLRTALELLIYAPDQRFRAFAWREVRLALRQTLEATLKRLRPKASKKTPV